MMHNIPQTRVGSKKSRYAALLSQIVGLQEEMGKIRREMRTTIEEEVKKSLGDKIAMIDGALTETILQKEVLIEKGLMTREEINQKYRELKAKQVS